MCFRCQSCNYYCNCILQGKRDVVSLTYLQLSILGCVMKRCPTPAVHHYLPAVKQQPAENLGMAAAGSKVHGSGPIIVSVRQAYVCKTHLYKTKMIKCFFSLFVDFLICRSCNYTTRTYRYDVKIYCKILLIIVAHIAHLAEIMHF